MNLKSTDEDHVVSSISGYGLHGEKMYPIRELAPDGPNVWVGNDTPKLGRRDL